MLIGITILNVISLAGPLVLPLFNESLQQSLHLSAAKIGEVAAVGMVSAMVSNLLTKYWVHRFSWTSAARILLIGLIVADLLWFVCERHWVSLLAIQSLTGLLSGSLYSLTLAVIGDGTHADRMFGVIMSAQVAFQVVGLLSGPLILRHGSLNLIITIFALFYAASLLLTSLLPARSRSSVTTVSFISLMRLPTMLGLAGCVFFMLNVGAYWTYVELIGKHAGLGDAGVATSLAMGVSVGLLGGLAASWNGRRFNRNGLLAVGALMIVGSVWLLLPPLSMGQFAISCGIYNLAWNFSLALNYSAINAIDPTGHVLPITPAFHSAGAAAGPAIAALLVGSYGYDCVIWLAAGGAILSVGCFFASSAVLRTRIPANGNRAAH
jgi:MFS transporter, DHA1 family, inner membrane transport protein